MEIKTVKIEHKIKVFSPGEIVESKSPRSGFPSGTLMTVCSHIPGYPGYADDAGVLFFEEERCLGNKQLGHSDEYWGIPSRREGE